MVRQACRGAQQRQVVLQVLAEADAGIEHHAWQAGRLGQAGSLEQEQLDLTDDVGVRRRRLHGARLALHVHDHDRRAGGGADGQHGGVAQAADVVDDGRARRQRGGGDLGLARVDADDGAGRDEPGDHGQHPARLLLRADGQGARARRLAADVKEHGALVAQPQAGGDGRLGVEGLAGVAEAVGGDVDDADQGGAAPLEHGGAVRQRAAEGQPMLSAAGHGRPA